MTCFPAEKGKNLFFDAKRRGLADKIAKMSADVGEFREKINPVFLRNHFSEHRGFFRRLRKAEKWAKNSGNTMPSPGELLDWEKEYSQLRKMWEEFCDDKPDILEAEKRRRWAVLFRGLDLVLSVAARVGVVAVFALM